MCSCSCPWLRRVILHQLGAELLSVLHPADTHSCPALLSLHAPRMPHAKWLEDALHLSREEGLPSGKSFTPDFRPAKGLLGWNSPQQGWAASPKQVSGAGCPQACGQAEIQHFGKRWTRISHPSRDGARIGLDSLIRCPPSH